MEILRWIVQNYGKEKKEQQEDGRSKQASNEKAQFVSQISILLLPFL